MDTNSKINWNMTIVWIWCRHVNRIFWLPSPRLPSTKIWSFSEQAIIELKICVVFQSYLYYWGVISSVVYQYPKQCTAAFIYQSFLYPDSWRNAQGASLSLHYPCFPSSRPSQNQVLQIGQVWEEFLLAFSPLELHMKSSLVRRRWHNDPTHVHYTQCWWMKKTWKDMGNRTHIHIHTYTHRHTRYYLAEWTS